MGKSHRIDFADERRRLLAVVRQRLALTPASFSGPPERGRHMPDHQRAADERWHAALTPEMLTPFALLRRWAAGPPSASGPS